MLQIQPTSASTDPPGIPPTGEGGWFKSSLFPLTFEHSRRDLNNPPTSVGGISEFWFSALGMGDSSN
jgi:hypothetical protein